MGELLHHPAQLLGLRSHWGDRGLLEHLAASLATCLLCQLQWEPSVECWANSRWEDCASLSGEAAGNGGLAGGVCVCMHECRPTYSILLASFVPMPSLTTVFLLLTVANPFLHTASNQILELGIKTWLLASCKRKVEPSCIVTLGIM